MLEARLARKLLKMRCFLFGHRWVWKTWFGHALKVCRHCGKLSPRQD